MNSDLKLALSLADAADRITLQHYRSSSLAVRTKTDRSPVSEADEAVEKMIRDRLAQERPGDGILGEEFGSTVSGSRRWIIDPIDGTRNYIRGVPIYATLIALQVESRITVGVISAPAIPRRWWAAKGEGAYCDGHPIAVSSVKEVAEAFLGYDSVTDCKGEQRTRFLELIDAVDRSRGFGDFWAHMLVAEGALDIAVEPKVAAWDMAAVQIIVEEAGGRFSDLEGRATFDGGSALSTNGLLHDDVLGRLR